MIQQHDQRGITIVEMTVVLSVMFILAGVMSPIVSESVATARAVRAKNDATMIAAGIVNFQKDLSGDAGGFGASRAAALPELPAVLMTAGTEPITEEAESAPPRGGHKDASALAQGATDEVPAPVENRRAWLQAGRDRLEDHLVHNRRGYRVRNPGEYGGWNGPYVNAALKGDPWGNSYLVNTAFLRGSTAGDGRGGIRRAVFVVSAGADGILQTPFDQPLTEAKAYGDDIVVRIQ